MEMWRELWVIEQFQKTGLPGVFPMRRPGLGFYGRDTNPEIAFKMKNLPQQIYKTGLTVPVAADIDAGNNDFFCSGLNRFAGLGNYLFERSAHRPATDARNDAERAIIVTTVLDLDCPSCVESAS